MNYGPRIIAISPIFVEINHVQGKSRERTGAFTFYGIIFIYGIYLLSQVTVTLNGDIRGLSDP